MPSSTRGTPEGIVLRHSRRCSSLSDEGACDCRPGYQAQVFSPRDRRTIRKTFKALADARAWRVEAQSALHKGTLRAPSRITLDEAAEEWLAAAKAGVIRTRSGDRYKPGVMRGYEQALRTRILPAFGHLRTSALTRNAVQDLCSLGPESATGRPAHQTSQIKPRIGIFRARMTRTKAAELPSEECRTGFAPGSTGGRLAPRRRSLRGARR
jgi:hypothetical protein